MMSVVMLSDVGSGLSAGCLAMKADEGLWSIGQRVQEVEFLW